MTAVEVVQCAKQSLVSYQCFGQNAVEQSKLITMVNDCFGVISWKLHTYYVTKGTKFKHYLFKYSSGTPSLNSSHHTGLCRARVA